LDLSRRTVRRRAAQIIARSYASLAAKTNARLSSDQKYDRDESDDRRGSCDLVRDALVALSQIFRGLLVAKPSSNAIPTKSLSRHINRHCRTVRKLSNDKSNSTGKTFSPSKRMPAPEFVTSRTQQAKTPACPRKNSIAFRLISVRSLERRSAPRCRRIS